MGYDLLRLNGNVFDGPEPAAGGAFGVRFESQEGLIRTLAPVTAVRFAMTNCTVRGDAFRCHHGEDGTLDIWLRDSTILGSGWRT